MSAAPQYLIHGIGQIAGQDIRDIRLIAFQPVDGAVAGEPIARRQGLQQLPLQRRRQVFRQLKPEVHDLALPVPYRRPDRRELDFEQMGDDLLMKFQYRPQTAFSQALDFIG